MLFNAAAGFHESRFIKISPQSTKCSSHYEAEVRKQFDTDPSPSVVFFYVLIYQKMRRSLKSFKYHNIFVAPFVRSKCSHFDVGNDYGVTKTLC